jgi:hypothetical protein
MLKYFIEVCRRLSAESGDDMINVVLASHASKVSFSPYLLPHFLVRSRLNRFFVGEDRVEQLDHWIAFVLPPFTQHNW